MPVHKLVVLLFFLILQSFFVAGEVLFALERSYHLIIIQIFRIFNFQDVLGK